MHLGEEEEDMGGGERRELEALEERENDHYCIQCANFSLTHTHTHTHTHHPHL